MSQPAVKNGLFTLFCVLTSILSLNAQSNPSQVQLINQYVRFTNESIHGLLIAHRLLELYNQDINKYVDLEGYQLNFYSNDDLPKNIFEDPEKWFYDTSPNEWLLMITEHYSSASSNETLDRLYSLSREMNNICQAINRIRFTVEEYIEKNDLNDPEKLEGVYIRLENAVTMYDDFFERQVLLEKQINRLLVDSETLSGLEKNKSRLYVDMKMTNYHYKQMLRALRHKEEIAFASQLDSLEQSYEQLSSSLSGISPVTQKSNFARTKIIDKLNAAIETARRFIHTGDVPREYRLYGKFYYYHNSDLINKLNRYGNGITHEMNLILENLELPIPKLIEEPHFYQVIYPEKITRDHAIESTDDQIELLPVQLKDRKVISSSRTIQVDRSPFEIQLYDHMIQDGDIISLNFNGDWILENYSLEAKPKTLKLKLNDEGVNYLLLHAETIGYRPPNTMAISYYSGGEKHQIILKSDLNTSEMILIEQRSGN